MNASSIAGVRRARSGFTLIELVVAVAIVLLLAMLTLGAVQTVRERSDATVCASNLRQLAVAAITYAADHGGSFVPAQDRKNKVRWHGVRSGVTQPFDPAKGPLAPYLGKEGRVKLCPTFRDALKGSAKTFEEGTGGYGYNAAYVGGRPGDPFTAERLVNVTRPVQTVMFTDTAFARSLGIQEYAYCEPWQWEDDLGNLQGALTPSVHFRHGDRASVAWCDGHITLEPWTRLGGGTRYGGNSAKWKIGWFGPEENNGYWRAAQAAPGE